MLASSAIRKTCHIAVRHQRKSNLVAWSKYYANFISHKLIFDDCYLLSHRGRHQWILHMYIVGFWAKFYFHSMHAPMSLPTQVLHALFWCYFVLSRVYQKSNYRTWESIEWAWKWTRCYRAYSMVESNKLANYANICSNEMMKHAMIINTPCLSDTMTKWSFAEGANRDWHKNTIISPNNNSQFGLRVDVEGRDAYPRCFRLMLFLPKKTFCFCFVYRKSVISFHVGRPLFALNSRDPNQLFGRTWQIWRPNK